MKLENCIPFVLLLLIIATACSTQKDKQVIISDTSSIQKAPIELKAKLVELKKLQSHKELTVNTLLINNNFSAVNYLNFSCGYSDAFCTDVQQLKVEVEDCNSNYPKQYSLCHFHAVERKITLILDSGVNYKNRIPFRVGFHLIPADINYYKESDKFFKSFKDSTNIIWSNVLKL